jgi:hypothetical protein
LEPNVSDVSQLEAVWGLGRHSKFVPRESALKQLQVCSANGESFFL